MKKLLLLITVVALTFQSCNDNDEGIPDPILSTWAGTWSGTYAGDDSGTWTLTISDSGDFVSGTSFSNNAQQTQSYISATFSADGSGTSESENGTIGTSQVTGDIITGTWVNPNFNLKGTSTGTRE